MNVNKIMLKSVVLTALMQSLQSQGKDFTESQRTAVLAFNDELVALEASGNAVLDQPIDEVFETLLAAVDTLPNTKSEGL